MHFRYNIPDWPKPVARLPKYYSVKAVDNVQLLAEAKSVNPDIVRILRHYTSDQNPADTYEGNKVKARNFLKTFIDGTFLDGETKGIKHRTTEYIEDWNEYGWFKSQDPETKRRFRLWAIAFLDVWYEEYWPTLGTNACIANIPIGNDIDLEVAERVAFWTDPKIGRIPRIGYHAYWPVRKHKIAGIDVNDDWWIWYAGRWAAVLDAQLQNEGLRVHWALTEAGAIGYRGDWPDIALNGEDGWRHSDVHGGDIKQYLATINEFMKRWYAWNFAHDYRCLSPNMYDSSQGQDEWKLFQLWTPQLDEIVDGVFSHYPTEQPKIPMDKPKERAHGVDVSRWQGTIKWDKTAEKGVSFAFIKVTQGITWQDPKFFENWIEAKSKNILVGPYHYFLPESDPIKQANWFYDVVDTTDIMSDLPFVGDIEESPNEMSGEAFRLRLWDFFKRVGVLSQRKPLLYTSPGFYNRWLQGTNWSEVCDLYIAHWGVVKPTVPPAWNNWTFWQYNVLDEGGDYGMQSSRVDVDYFNGTIDELYAYARVELPPTTDQYQLKANSNIRLQPRYQGEVGAANKIATLNAGSVVKVIDWVDGDEYQGSTKWAKLELGLIYSNGDTLVEAFIHGNLIMPI